MYGFASNKGYGAQSHIDALKTYNSSLFFSESFLESLIYKISQSFGKITAPATTGPARGEEEYFVLGDNRNNSLDGRDPSVGNIKRENIIGRAWLRIWLHGVSLHLCPLPHKMNHQIDQTKNAQQIQAGI